VKSDALSTLPAYAPSGTITGKTWETTPDGRMGCDEYFVRAGSR
jgi:hypothetical protein